MANIHVSILDKQSASGPQPQTISQSKLPLYLSLALVVAAVASYFLIPAVQHFLNEAWSILTSGNEGEIKEWVAQFGIWGPMIIILAMVLQMFLLVIPTPLLMVVTVLAYGAIIGSIIILVAVFSASTIGYLIGAYLGQPIVGKLMGRKTEEKISSFIDDYGFWTIIVTRLSPFLSNDAISLIAGMLRMGYWRFIAATLVGIAPLTFLIAYLGEDINRLKSGLIWGSIISFILFAGFIWWDKRRTK